MPKPPFDPEPIEDSPSKLQRFTKYMRKNFYTLLYKFLLLTATFLTVHLLIVVATGYNRFSADYQINFELPFKNWIVIEPRTTTTKAKPIIRQAEAKEVEQPKTYTTEQIVDAVHLLESSGGRKDGCVSRGEGVNGFGFAQHGSGDVWNCYKSYAQVRTLVEQWFAEKVPAMGLPAALCYYNLGKVEGKLVSDCSYYQNFLKVVES
jgi:hypothetical protein